MVFLCKLKKALHLGGQVGKLSMGRIPDTVFLLGWVPLCDVQLAQQYMKALHSQQSLTDHYSDIFEDNIYPSAFGSFN